MSTIDFTSQIAALNAADLLENVKKWTSSPADAGAPDIAGWLAALASEGKQEYTKADMAALRVALFCVAHSRNTAAFKDICSIITSDAIQKKISSDDWIIPNLHRILGSVATPDDASALEAIALNDDYTTETKEQALLTLHFLWLENSLTTDSITTIYKSIMAKALKKENLGQRMAIALVLNSAVVGGALLRTEIAAMIDSGVIGEQTELITKAIQNIMTDNRAYREIYKKQHKSYFNKPEDEIPNINSPFKEETPELPGKGKPITRTAPKIGRNDPCPCGSGKKYKKCCGAAK